MSFERWETPVSAARALVMVSLLDSEGLHVTLETPMDGRRRFRFSFRPVPAYRNVLEEYRLSEDIPGGELGRTMTVPDSAWLADMRSREPLLDVHSRGCRHYLIVTEDDVLDILSPVPPDIVELAPAAPDETDPGKSRVFFKVGAGEWFDTLELLRAKGVTLEAGLSEAELRKAEETYAFRFPPDLRSLLAKALPVSGGFADWRSGHPDYLREAMEWPFEGMAFDIEKDAFWLPVWGARPEDLKEALAVARRHYDAAPRMVPVFGHRYIPSEPCEAGNPVFSIYQTDIIYYGRDLRSYLACELGALEWEEAVKGELRRIRFWNDVMEAPPNTR